MSPPALTVGSIDKPWGLPPEMEEVPLDKRVSSVVMIVVLVGIVRVSEMASLQLSWVATHQITPSSPEMKGVLLERDWRSTLEKVETASLEMSATPLTIRRGENSGFTFYC